MKPDALRRIFNFWPPFLGAGIAIEAVDAEWRYARVRLKLRWYNRNYVRTQFGGSLFAMADPWWMILVMERLGRDFIVWDKAGTIDFIAPGRGDVIAEFSLDDETVDALRAEALHAGKALRWFETEIRDESGTLVARVRKQIHVQRKRAKPSSTTAGG
jgi:acyl-coenzyme A thioesterase PaaI-like protein